MSKIDSNRLKKPLFLDVGNTSIKGAYKIGAHWEAIHAEPRFTAADLINWIEASPKTFSHIVAASVRDDVKEAIRAKLSHVSVELLSVQDIPDELIDYDTVKTLGIDRFLGCYGAKTHTKRAVVVIDAGTALTIDYMDKDNVYHGGVIAPGISGFKELLSANAPALPAVEWKLPAVWPGKSTVSSLQWGQAGFYKAALEGILQNFRKEFGSYALYITGGDRMKVAALLGKEDRVRSYLIFDGLYRMIYDKEN